MGGRKEEHPRSESEILFLIERSVDAKNFNWTSGVSLRREENRAAGSSTFRESSSR